MAGQFEPARARLARQPRDQDALFDMASAALAERREIEALTLIDHLPRTAHARDAAMWQWTALLNRALDRHEKAAAAFARAAVLAPGDAQIAHGAARVALEAGRPAAALFEQAHRLAPHNGDVLLGRAAALVAEGDRGRAIHELEAMLIQHPGWLPGHDLIARLRYGVEGSSGFVASLHQALAGAPRDPALWRMLIGLLLQDEALDDARAGIADARLAIGDHLFLDLSEAIVSSESGDHAQADTIFARIGPVADTAIGVRHVRHLLRTGRPMEAVVRAEPLLRRADANLIWPYVSIAWRLLGDARWQWLEGDPRLVGVIDLGLDRNDIVALAHRLRCLHAGSQQQLDQSVRGGSQTAGSLFSRQEPEIRAVRPAIVEAIAAYCRQLPPRDPSHPFLAYRSDTPARFAGSWSVQLRRSGHHANHIHPAGWLSSACYVALPPSTGNADRSGWLTLGQPQRELGLDLSPVRWIEPKVGQLVLFPSMMWHGTLPFANGERLSIAFDVARAIGG